MPTSKIDAWVNTYHPAFYTSITAKETWTYANYAGNPTALAEWETYFTNLMTQLNAWKNATKPHRTPDKGRELIQGIYGYVALNTVYGTSFGSISFMDGWSIYNIDGFVSATISRSVDWYNDMIVTGAPPPYTSARMDADITSVTTAVTSNVEETNFNIAVNSARQVVGAFGYGSMFTDYPSTGATLSKTLMQAYLFTTLHYQNIGDGIPSACIPVPPIPLP